MFNVRKNNLQNYGICPWVGRRIIFHMMSNPQDFRTERNIILQMRKEKKKLRPQDGQRLAQHHACGDVCTSLFTNLYSVTEKRNSGPCCSPEFEESFNVSPHLKVNMLCHPASSFRDMMVI